MDNTIIVLALHVKHHLGLERVLRLLLVENFSDECYLRDCNFHEHYLIAQNVTSVLHIYSRQSRNKILNFIAQEFLHDCCHTT